MPPPTVWAAAGAVLALFCIAFLTQTFRRGMQVKSRGGGLRRWMALVWIAGMLGVALAQLANLATPATDRGGGPYVGGILVLLAISGLQFILLALSSVSGHSAEE